MTDGIDDAILNDLEKQIAAEKATFEIIAFTVGGVETKQGKKVAANQKLDGAPSVLYDAIALLITSEAIPLLVKHPAARQFVSDAFTHLKVIGYTSDSKALFEKIGIASELDEGCIELATNRSIKKYLEACKNIRIWKREPLVLPSF